MRIVLQNGDFHLDIRDSSFVTEILLLGGPVRPSFSAVMIYVTVEFCIPGVCSVCIVLRPALLVTEAHVSEALNKSNRGGGLRSLALVCMDRRNLGTFFIRFGQESLERVSEVSPMLLFNKHTAILEYTTAIRVYGLDDSYSDKQFLETTPN